MDAADAAEAGKLTPKQLSASESCKSKGTRSTAFQKCVEAALSTKIPDKKSGNEAQAEMERRDGCLQQQEKPDGRRSPRLLPDPAEQEVAAKSSFQNEVLCRSRRAEGRDAHVGGVRPLHGIAPLCRLPASLPRSLHHTPIDEASF